MESNNQQKTIQQTSEINLVDQLPQFQDSGKDNYNQEVENNLKEMQNEYLSKIEVKPEKDIIQIEFKQIKKQYGDQFDKNDLWLLYEFTQFEKDIVLFLLKNYSVIFIKQLKRDLMKHPEKGYKKMYEIIQAYCKKHNINDWAEEKIKRQHERYVKDHEQFWQWKQDQQKQEKNHNYDKNQKKEEIKQDEEYEYGEEEEEEVKENSNQEDNMIVQQQQGFKPGIIVNLSDCVLLKILEFLDPISLGNFQITSKHNKILARSSFLFKKICMALHKQGLSPLPQTNHFLQLQLQVYQRPYDFPTHFRQEVQKDVRKVIWSEPDSQFVTPISYFKQFKGWYSLYLSAPRPNFGGVYRIKEKYVKFGEAEFGKTYQPVIEVEYYRYVRFLPDGSVRYKISNKKLKKDDIIQYMIRSDEEQSQIKEVKIGEYRWCKDQVIFKYAVGSCIFEYFLTIQHLENKPNYVMAVNKQTQRNPEINFCSVLYQQGPYVSEKYFKYIPIKEIRQDIDEPLIGSCSL